MGLAGALADPALLVVVALALITFVVRLLQIHQSLLGDEVFTYSDINGKSFRAVLTNVNTGGENSPPLFFLLAWATAKLGDPTVWIRLPSIILGAATLPVIYLIGRETVSRTAGVIGACAVALSPFSFYYGVEARPYATMAFFVAVSTLALLRAVATGERRWWVVYVLAAAAAAYSHYTSIFVLAVQAAWGLWACRDQLKVPLIANALIVALYVPWLPNLRGKALAVIEFLQPLTIRNVARDLTRPIAGYPYASLRAIPTYLGLAVVILCAVVGLAFTVRGWRDRTHPAQRSRLALIFALAVATPIGLLAYSTLETDLWLARGLYASMPAAAVVLGALLAAIPRPAGAIAILATGVTLLFGTLRAGTEAYARAPFRTMAAYLDRIAPAQDPIALVSLIGNAAISEQFQKPHRVVALKQLYPSTAPHQNAYLVLDDTVAKRIRIPPVPRDFTLVSHRHYPGLFPTEILVYRRS